MLESEESLSRGTVLVVDDTLENLDVLDDLLTGHGYEVRRAIDGVMALRAVAAEPPDLILLDIMMPGMNGYEVCAKLKADSATWGIPVLFISALDDAQDKVRAFETGGVDYIPKPFQAAEVVARVATHLQNALLQKILEDRGRALEEREQQVRQLRQRVKRLEEVLGYYGLDPTSI
ncbi:response regulator receiver sensor signal transduction histidine kinase [Gloeomargarita lithophora Alchichica-D10]|uniref:Response regulator receiver sensor signal transduction histidine kinase n=1 Tax=Gloeomargarita lithophora Alchichica-D10 TaxID=1188229 RepID=A0A1J0ADF6_9CYAN|nr:response regulator [Gloeomargarita lithophora]APB33953.1 response regulator receiver sensor signal transduction histidine kinase [Gloeomargarita lithophora Alchichica-D10]